jgi:hypothetical protein
VEDEQKKATPPTSSAASSPASAPYSAPYSAQSSTQSSGPVGALTPADVQPHVMIFSNGDLTSFRVTLGRDGTETTITVLPDKQGRIKVKVPKEHVT